MRACVCCHCIRCHFVMTMWYVYVHSVQPYAFTMEDLFSDDEFYQQCVLMRQDLFCRHGVIGARRKFQILRAAEKNVEGRNSTWCLECGMWLNGPSQLQDHESGKRHKRKLQQKLPLKEPPAGPCSAFQGTEHERQQAIEALELVILELHKDSDADSDFESAPSPKPQLSIALGSAIAPSPSGCMGRSCEREINATCTYCRLQFCPWHWAQCGLCAAFICNRCCQRHRQECKSTCIKINAMLAFQGVGSG